MKKIAHAIMMVILIIAFIAFVFPFILVVINVFKTKGDINSAPLALVGSHGFTLENFPNAIKKMNFWSCFENSLIITVSATVLTMLFSSMAAFVIVRNKWKACTLLFSGMIDFHGHPVPGTDDSARISVRRYHPDPEQQNYTDFHARWIFTSMATFMFHGAIVTEFPLELEEAALIDGCTRWKTFWSVVFPLLKPTIATVAVIDAMAFWNDYLLPSLVLRKKEMYTLPIAMQVFYGTYTTDIGLILAALLLAMLPILILYVFLQRYIIEVSLPVQLRAD